MGVKEYSAQRAVMLKDPVSLEIGVSREHGPCLILHVARGDYLLPLDEEYADELVRGVRAATAEWRRRQTEIAHGASQA